MLFVENSRCHTELQLGIKENLPLCQGSQDSLSSRKD